MNDETICNPVPGAEVDGFNFFHDQNGTIVARCCWCMIGFDVTAENTGLTQSRRWMFGAFSVWTAVRAIANCGWSPYAALTV